jgi:plastocyanin
VFRFSFSYKANGRFLVLFNLFSLHVLDGLVNILSTMIFTATLAALVSLAALPVARTADIPVTVGGAGGVIAYSPTSVTANPGDVVVFSFMQKNHTATQSTLQTPCQPLDGGFDSGFVPVPDSNTNGPFPVATYTVTDTNPVWVYCRQGNHCQQGMVFAINPGDKLAAFQAAATGGAAPPATTATAPPATGVVTVTATVTVGGDVLTTTYGSWPGSAAPTAPASSDHQIVVGGPGKLLFTPSNISAQVGDTVTFQFQQKNHSATQSSFAAPCRALALTSTTGQVGFDSGFMPVPDGSTTFPTYTIQINDTAPVWVYCRQGNHCGSGMVFAVNAIETGPNNFDAFKAKAIQLNGTSASSSSAPAPTSSTGGASSTSVSHGAGIVVAVIAVVFSVLL